MGWIKFTEGGRAYAPKATISTIGALSFNESACSQYGLKPVGGAVLYYDPDKQLIGLEAVKDLKLEGARRLRRRAKGVEISARPFLEKFGILRAGTTSFPVSKDEKSGYVIVLLKDGKARKPRRAKNV
jgi:hypothetical protein